MTRVRLWIGAVVALALALAWAGIEPSARTEPLVVYSARKEELLKPVVEGFERATGIEVTLLSGKAGELARRIETERNNPRSDVFVGTTAGLSELLREKGLLEPGNGRVVAQLPAEFRAPDGSWIGVSGRARVIVYNTHRVSAGEAPRSFFELTGPKWRGKVAVASMAERTTVGHLATIWKLRGEAFTRDFVTRLRANGLKVLSNNTEVRKAVADGEYPIGITNHYYYLVQLHEAPGSPIGIVYPDQGPTDMGAPVQTITASVTRGAPHREAAQRFLEYLISPEGNRLLVVESFELPILDGVVPIGLDRGIRSIGHFKRARVTQLEAAELEPIVEKAFGPLLVP
jgi:iron(III) transport system substrate-binding protein